MRSVRVAASSSYCSVVSKVRLRYEFHVPLVSHRPRPPFWVLFVPSRTRWFWVVFSPFKANTLYLVFASMSLRKEYCAQELSLKPTSSPSQHSTRRKRKNRMMVGFVRSVFTSVGNIINTTNPVSKARKLGFGGAPPRTLSPDKYHKLCDNLSPSTRFGGCVRRRSRRRNA